MLKEYLSTLANKLRSVLETTEKINAQNFVDKIQEVYSKGQSYGYDIGYMTGAQAAYPQGKQDGYEQGITEGIEQGKQEGQLSVWNASESLQGNVSGVAISVNDVSPIKHNVGCTVGSKNLFGLTYEDFKNANNLGEGKQVFFTLKPNTSYTLSSNMYRNQDGATNIWFNGTNGEKNGVWENKSSTTTTDNNGKLYILVRETKLEEIFNNCWIQLEENSTATEYTPYTTDLSGIEVSRYGKNLCSDNFADWFKNTSPYAYRYIANTDWMISIRDKNTSVDASECYFGITNSTDNDREIVWSINNGKVAISDNVTQNISRKTTSDGVLCPYLLIYPANEETLNKIMRRWDIQVELGSTATPYTPYIEPTTYQSTTDGTVEGVTSISPNMTLLSDNNGVVINAHYYKDPDIVISNLQQAVALTGGE